MRLFKFLAVAAAMIAPASAHAQATQAAQVAADSGNTAWVLISSALVLLMTMPGLTLFYGGLVRTKNFLSVMVQVGAIASAVSITSITTDSGPRHAERRQRNSNAMQWHHPRMQP